MRPLQGNDGATEFVFHDKHGQANVACAMERGIKFGGTEQLDTGTLEKLLADGSN